LESLFFDNFSAWFAKVQVTILAVVREQVSGLFAFKTDRVPRSSFSVFDSTFALVAWETAVSVFLLDDDFFLDFDIRV